MADSAFVARFDRESEAVDTIGVLRVPIPEFERVGSNMMMTSGPLMPRDDWAVGLDGSVAFVRAADYSVEWLLPSGESARSEPVEYTPVRVGRAEQERWVDEAQANMMHLTVVALATLFMVSCGGSQQPQPAPAAEPAAEEAAEPAADSAVEPTADSAAEPAADSAAEPVPEPPEADTKSGTEGADAAKPAKDGEAIVVDTDAR